MHEVPEMDIPESIVLPVIHKREIVSHGRSIAYKSFGVPFYIVLAREERSDFRRIYDKLCRRYSQFFGAAEFQLEDPESGSHRGTINETIFNEGLFTIRIQHAFLKPWEAQVWMPTQFHSPDTLRDLEKCLGDHGSSWSWIGKQQSHHGGDGSGGLDLYSTAELSPTSNMSRLTGVQQSHTRETFEYNLSPEISPNLARTGDNTLRYSKRKELLFGEGLICVWSDRNFERILDDRNVTCWIPRDVWKNPQDRLSNPDFSELTLNHCFDEFSSVENLDGERAWFCPHCEEMVPAKTSLHLWRIPEILIVQLKRFDPGRGGKVDELIKFPVMDFDLTNRIGDKSWLKEISPERQLMYDLFATANHSGRLCGGHWTANVYNYCDSQWYSFNGNAHSGNNMSEELDSSVSQLNRVESLVHRSSLLLFYKRQTEDSSERKMLKM